MEENKNLQTDAFLKKQIQEISLDSPSKDFTKNLMGVLSVEEKSKITEYVPLISKKGWGVIGFIVAIISVALFLIPNKNNQETILDKISLDFSLIPKFSISSFLEMFSVSNTTLFSLGLLSVFMFIQVFYLKGYFSKKAL